jgi:hypothetical protein
MAKPGATPGTGSVRARQEKAPPLLPFTTPMERDQRDPVSVGERPPASTNAFATESRPGDDVFGTHTRQPRLTSTPGPNARCRR